MVARLNPAALTELKLAGASSALGAEGMMARDGFDPVALGDALEAQTGIVPNTMISHTPARKAASGFDFV